MTKKQVSPPTHVSSHTQKAKVYEGIAKVLVWGSAGITIFILVWIIGYIVYKGIISDVRTEYSVVGQGSIVVPLDELGLSKVVCIVHKDVRIKNISIQMIRSFFNGDERYWLVSEQGLKVRPFAPSPDTIFGKKVMNALSRGYAEDDLSSKTISEENESESSIIEEGEYARSVVCADDDNAIIDFVAHTQGGIGIIDAESLDKALVREVKPVTVRYLSLMVNTEVLAMENNTHLSSITEVDVREIFSSRVRTWEDVGGHNLPVTVMSYKEDSYLGAEFRKQVLNHDPFGIKTEYFDTSGEMIAAVEHNKGAVGYGLYLSLYKHYSDHLLPVERREVKPNITFHFLFEKPEKAGKAGGISSIILNTLLMIILTLLVAAPIGIGAAIYLTEYAKQGRLISVLRFFTETLAAIPSIIFGLFGYILFVNTLNWGMGLLSGTLTITIMILPTIIRTAEEAFKSVPREFREESLALGATLWQTIKRVVTPAALPGILTGIILAIGRAVGETAAVLFTLGSSPAMAKDIFSSARVLSLHLYILAKEGISFERAFATALILVVIILIVNTSTTVLVGRMNRYGRK